MKTTFKAILASELLAVCSETTERQRVKVKEKPDQKYTEKEIKDIQEAMAGWGSEAVNQLLKAFSILVKAPELAAGSKSVFDLFSVVVCEKDVNSHPWRNKAPFIVVHSKNQCGLSPTGDLTTYYRDNDKPRLATAVEVMKCIENLSDAQWKRIGSDALFSPIVATAMNREVVIDENEMILTEVDKQAADEAG